MNKKSSLSNFRGVPAALGAVSLLLAGGTAQAQYQVSPGQLKATGASRVSTLDVLSGDYGMSGGTYYFQNGYKIDVSKFGGMGDIGLTELGPKPLGNTGFAWQPRLQGNMGYSTAKNTFTPGTTLDGQSLNGDENIYNTFAIQFGGGARIWLADHFSFAPTIMGMYGNTRNTYDVNGGGITPAQYTNFKNAGLIGWTVDTWTLRPAGELSYDYTWGRTIFTLVSSGTYYHTESFTSSTANFSVNSDAETWANKLDVDIPLGVSLGNHELRTGGYFCRTDFFGDMNTGLNTDHMYEAHGRVVLDFLKQLWKVQWIGVGYSYLWGSNFHGYTYGADVTFQF